MIAKTYEKMRRAMPDENFLKISPDFADKSAAVSYYRHGMKKTRNLPGFGPLKEMNPKW
jgi:hypothetical protein